MGHRSVQPLTRADWGKLPPVCPGCPLPSRGDVGAAWVEASLRQLGFYGLGMEVDGNIPAFVLVAPSAHVPRWHPLHSQVRPDSVVLLQCHAEALRDMRRLVQATATRLAPTSTRWIAAMPGHGDCVSPTREALKNCGFRDDLTRRGMVLDLTRTVRLREVLGELRRKIPALPLPIPKPEPSGRAGEN